MTTNKVTRRRYQVIEFGGGVSGTSGVRQLIHYTNIRDILLLEKYGWVAQMNSHPLNNAQTGHRGEKETNYPLKEALEVRRASGVMCQYVDDKNDSMLSQKITSEVLGVGQEEVEMLQARRAEFSPYYPELELIYWDDIEKFEPNLTKGRSHKEEICALISEGRMINYQSLSEYLFEEARAANPDFDYAFNTAVIKVRREKGYYVVETTSGTFEAEIVVFNTGSYSLFFARELGYGLNLALCPVAGDFFSTGRWVNSKVYRPQKKGKPFAELHIDPDILNPKVNRIGPTTLFMPLMERHHYETFGDFMHLPLLTSARGIATLANIVHARGLKWYGLRNALYRLPIAGKELFVMEFKKTIPTIQARDLRYRKGSGGIRPQVVNLDTMDFAIGDASIVGQDNGDKIIANTTPSPGATKAMDNGIRDARQIVKFAGSGYCFDEKKFREEHRNILHLIDGVAA